MSHLLMLQAEPPRLQGQDVSSLLAEFWPVLLPAALGLAAVYWLLPRARLLPRLGGIVLGGVALLLSGWLLIRVAAAPPETILFYAFSAVAVIAGGLLVTHHNPVYAVLSFALVVLSTCGLFLLLAAPFLMAATVIIYAGAIIVTFLFVIMLAQQAGQSSADMRSREPLLATLAGFILLAAILCVLQRTYLRPVEAAAVRELAPLVALARQAANAESVEAVQKALGDQKTFFNDFRRHAEPEEPKANSHAVGRKSLADALDEAEAQMVLSKQRPDLSAVQRRFRDVYREGTHVLHALQASPEPAAALPLSRFSGTPANTVPPPDATGRVPEQLPAENVASLGRSLFTDYLLAVELAGTLLLVATIGAIAIAGRRAEGLE
jgi:NADH:ubiquinone oxidoreductase subunit 6 (subunit J)